ncbi:MAG: hypothetical protein P1U44_08420 [Vicingaceae bacterium]|jgi:hypothetical protein|nr:hypothetical protein [Vicingaceae bacterium]
MKKTFILINLFLITFILPAQKKGLENNKVLYVGETYETKPILINFYKSFLFEEDNMIFDLFLSNKKIYLRKYNLSTLNLEESANFELFSKEVSLEKILKIKDRIFIFYSLREGEYNNYKESLYYREIDPKTCSFKDNGELLFKTDFEVTSVYESGYSSYNNFEIKLSVDSELLAVSYKIDKLKKESAIYCYKVFDTGFNLKWEKDITMPYEVEYLQGIDFAINKQGDIFSAFYVYGNKNKYFTNSKLQKDFDIEIYKIEASSDKPYKYKINIDSNYVANSVKFVQTEEGVKSVGLSSFVAYNNRFFGPSGIFIFNPQDSTSEIKNHVISDSIIFLNEKASTIANHEAIKRRYGEGKYKPYVSDLGIESIKILEDGSLLLVAEQSRTVNRSAVVPIAAAAILIVPNFNMMFESAYFTKINKDGSVAWTNKLVKKQETDMQVTVDGYNKLGKDMVIIEDESKINIIYNDHLKNLSLNNSKPPKRLKNRRNGVLLKYSINKISGNSTKEFFSKANRIKDVKVNQFNTSCFVAYYDDSAIFEITKNYNSHLVKFKLNK